MNKYVSAEDFASSITAKPTDKIGYLDAQTIIPRDPVEKQGKQYQDLLADVRENGFSEPIYVTEKNGALVTTEGSHRVEVARELNFGAEA